MANILVTGGAGYIGSHTCFTLNKSGHLPIAYDNLVNGHSHFVKWGPLEKGDIRDGERLKAVLLKHKPEAILHFAALIEVGQSVKEPATFYDNNVSGAITLLRAAQACGINKLVFSSTCATYGVAKSVPISEDHDQVPINPYGRSKLLVEQILADLDKYDGFRSVSLRYFNASGAHPDGLIGELHTPETHALPLAIEAALGQRAGFEIFGTDYATPDGTCVRDFVHVLDLANAHVLAVEHLLNGGSSIALNLGTAQATTIKELLSAVKRVSGRDFKIRIGPRRDGDSPALVADSSLAEKTLGWNPVHDLESIVRTAWNWHFGRFQTAEAASRSNEPLQPSH